MFPPFYPDVFVSEYQALNITPWVGKAHGAGMLSPIRRSDHNSKKNNR